MRRKKWGSLFNIPLFLSIFPQSGFCQTEVYEALCATVDSMPAEYYGDAKAFSSLVDGLCDPTGDLYFVSVKSTSFVELYSSVIENIPPRLSTCVFVVLDAIVGCFVGKSPLKNVPYPVDLELELLECISPACALSSDSRAASCGSRCLVQRRTTRLMYGR